MDPAALVAAAEAVAALPLPGRGDTAGRLRGLAALGGGDLAVARLAEGHADAVAILADAGRGPVGGCTYGVWASVAPSGDVHLRDGVLGGTKPFCSGAGVIDRALVRCDDLLVEVDLHQPGVRPVDGSWPAVGMAGSDSRAVELTAVRGEVVMTGDRYLRRPGFWHGGVGVAAVWAGAARATLATTAGWLGTGTGDAELAALGTAIAAVAAAEALLEGAARAIDADPADADAARLLALRTRHGVHALATTVVTACAAAGGARPICLDDEGARRSADLWAYLSQHHPGKDAARLGRLWLDAQPPDERP